MFRLVALVFILICSQAASAANFLPADFLPPYSGAVEINQKISIESQHHLALSKNKKIDGRWKFEKELKLQGVLIKTLYEITTEDSFADIAAFYQEQVGKPGVKVLFQCQGRSCGSSNEWANTLFRESRLYGPDKNQYYWAIDYDKRYWSVYLNQHGNNRIYWYVEEIQPANVAGLTSVALSVPCHIKNDEVRIKSFMENKQDRYFLLQNISGINTSASSQVQAEICANALKNHFGNVDVRAIGLGEFDRVSKRRVQEDKIELIRFDSSQ